MRIPACTPAGPPAPSFRRPARLWSSGQRIRDQLRKGGRLGGTVSLRAEDHVVRLRPEGVGAVQRPAPPDQPEPGSLLAARPDLRRGRPRELRTAGPTFACA